MEIGIALVIALIVLGPKRLPAAGRSLASGLREFKGAITGANRDGDESHRSGAAAWDLTGAW